MGETKGVGADAVGTAAAPYQASTAKDGDDMATPTPKRSTSPAFQFYPKDYLSDEEQSLMSLAEAGAYIRLMCRCWLKGTLPADTAELAKLCGATPGQMAKFWPAISKCFIQRSDGRWTHPRLEKERKKQSEYRRRQSDAAAMRWDKQRNAAAQASHSQRNALQSPISDLQSPSTTSLPNGSAVVSGEASSPPSVFIYPTVGALQTWELSEAQLGEWVDSYPNLDVRAECSRALTWLRANQAKRKTARGMPAFLVNWFNRASDRGGSPVSIGVSKTAGNVEALQRFARRGTPEAS